MAIAKIALPIAAHSTFDYWIPEGLAADRGAIVRVHFARRALVGVIVGVGETSDVDRARLQPIAEVVADLPALPPDLLDLARFVADYYQEPLGMVLAQMLPPLGAPGARERMPVEALRMLPAGCEALPRRLTRAPGARSLFERWLAVPDATLPADVVAALSPHLRRTVGTWRAQGWIEAAPPGSPAPVAVSAAAAAGLTLNPDQRQAADAIAAAHGKFAPFLLEGVTGSGKTEVYLEVAAEFIAAGGQVLLLTPEINLTPQLEQRIAGALPGRRTATLHSGLAEGERRRNFRAAATGAADLVLGTRLSVFAPMPRLALVIVDEEHDQSYKQQEIVRYHGRDAAVWRARQRQVPVVLGSATPALETRLQAQRGRYRSLTLPARAVVPARLPTLRFVPNRAEGTVEGMALPLLDAIAVRLTRGEQSLVFINRRGFAPSLLCVACGWQAGCTRCSARLVVHREAGELRCHHCGHAERLPRACPACGNVDLLPMGHGTQRLEQALRVRFPAARIARIDRDSTQRRGAFEAMSDRVRAGEIDILVGTQMLAKGHDFPRLTLVGVLGADNALYSADFRATERLAALLFQVAGRAGRADLPGEVVVQTDFPTHPLYAALSRHDYGGFADVLLAERRIAGLPPFSHLALLAAEARERTTVDTFLDAAHAAGLEAARTTALPVEVFPPIAAGLARRAGLERGQVLAQSVERGALQRFLPRWREAIAALPGRRVRWSLDVDPLGFG
jgi:primosomal protein N' (replication factor Y) (superfamily II helicase)